MIKLTRRRFVQATLSAFAAASTYLYFFWKRPLHNGKILGASHKFGHLIREKLSLEPSTVEHFEYCILGGGIAGLSAAWRFKKKNISNYILLELEDKLGGNSVYGENEVSRYPWGAHYLPFPNSESNLVRELLEELGAIEGYDSKQLPIYKDEYVCHAPEERLFIHGKWQDGIVPQLGLVKSDQDEIERFHALMENFKGRIGSDNKPAFAIPIAYSSQDREFLDLDKISFVEWLKNNKFRSEYLYWYVNYATRDDYGTEASLVSAWAGIHYFAARRGEASKHEANSILTWPEGNGWIVRQMSEKLNAKTRSNSLVVAIRQDPAQVEIDYIDLKTNTKKRIVSKAVIYAAPRFTAPYIITDYIAADRSKSNPVYMKEFEYAPWMVANLTVDLPLNGSELGLYWDNVSYYSRSLGYVYANHQDLNSRHRNNRGVITYYYPLSAKAPDIERKIAINKTYTEWCEEILSDLEFTHRDIRKKVSHIDIWIWGHAMVRPTVGFIWGEARQGISSNIGRIYFAHSDMSGISIFEEANYQGVRAADEAILRV